MQLFPVPPVNLHMRPRTALVASADRSFRQRIAQVLGGLRWQVREAEGGAEAWTELSAEVLEEFFQLLDTHRFIVHGGLDYAQRLLTDTFGKDRADDLLALMRRSQEAAQGNLAKLLRTDPQQLGKLLDTEHPQTIALVLAHLDPRRASTVLDNLSEEHKVVAVQRLAEMRQFSPEMAQKVALILHRRLDSVGDTARRSYSGFKAVGHHDHEHDGESGFDDSGGDVVSR
jgi:flagellar motor switch protein FliG